LKVLSIFGTRPEMIKMWGTLKKLDDLNFEHIMVHTGQNFTPELKEFFFNDLQLREPDYQLKIDTSSYGAEVADVISKTDKIMNEVNPDSLLILGDTYSGLSIMPASNRGIKVFHMEAGLRAWDKRMPEQRNRILIDHMSDILLPYNNYHRENLIREGIHPSKIFVTGNTTFEPYKYFSKQINNSKILKSLNLDTKKYILVTAHRSENVDNPGILQNIFSALSEVNRIHQKKIIYPMHPRTKSKLKNIKIDKEINIIDPLGFYDFNKLIKNAFCILSDSGTAAEEGLYYKVPSVNLRMATERYETVESGGNIISGLETKNIVESIDTITKMNWNAAYDFAESHSPSNVVISAIRSQITNFF
jgi:UDP-N-acetylglucosamine 2-epimerase (non-hydrolysing)